MSSANVFLLYPGNQKFLEGFGELKPNRVWVDYLLVFLFVIIISFLAPHAISEWQSNSGLPDLNADATVGVAFLLILSLVLLLRAIRATCRRARLLREGQVIEGAITQCTRSMKLFNGAASNKRRRCVISLKYRFVSPNGIERAGKSSEVRDDLLYSSLPAPQTPVAVLYANDRTYQLL